MPQSSRDLLGSLSGVERQKEAMLARHVLKSTACTRLLARRGVVVDNPYTAQTYCEVPTLSTEETHRKLETAAALKPTSLEERVAICEGALDYIMANSDAIAADITGQMGKPFQQSINELKGVRERVRAMVKLAPEVLGEQTLPEKPGFVRKIVKEPVGVVLVIAPWNYPLLTAVNAIVPAVLAGNSVLVKHSSRTPLCSQHFEDAFRAAGAPEGLVSGIAIHGRRRVAGKTPAGSGVQDTRSPVDCREGEGRGADPLFQVFGPFGRPLPVSGLKFCKFCRN